jgi:hypothetical protein
MPSKGPFVVRLVSPDDSVAIDAYEPAWSETWRGGFKDASVRLHEPLNVHNPLLAPMTKLRIDDARTGKTLSETYIDLPGRSRSHAGEVWELGGVGGAARLFDRRRQYIAIDASFEGWEPGLKTKAAMTQEISTDPNNEDIDAVVMNWPDGLVLAAGNPTSGPRSLMRYNRLAQAGQFVGGMRFNHREGRTTGDLRPQLAVSLSGGVGSFEVARNHTAATTLNSAAASAGAGGQFDTGEAGKNLAFFRLIRDGGLATNVADDTLWTAARNLRVSALRRDQTGEWIYGAGTYDDNFLLAHQVVIDGLYWFCAVNDGVDWISPIDIDNAEIDETFTYQLDQLAYTEPTSFGEVIEDLALLEPDMVWQVRESNASGQHKFVLRRALTGDTIAGDNESGARYIASAVDGWEEPGGEHDFRNAVTIFWNDAKGNEVSHTYFSKEDFGIEVPELEQWGIIREGEPITLEDRLGSQANADRIAEQYLEQSAMRPRAGQLTLRRKLHDAWYGRDIEPWEVEAGYPMLVRDVDGLEPLTVTDLDVDDNEAVATLSDPVLTDEQLVNLYARHGRRR